MMILISVILAFVLVAAFCGREMITIGQTFLASLVEFVGWLKAIDDFIWKP